jgi:DNA-binding transcriptional MerR regulator
MGWTITELTEAAAAALSGEPIQLNGRTRDLPNARMIRWYTTIGLVDPPLARRGRTALYGRRHLLQLVAVKRRQAAGRTIAQIQVELTGATDRTLEQVAGLPDDTPATPSDSQPPRARFWAAAPARAHADTEGPAPTEGSATGSPSPERDIAAVRTSHAAADLAADLPGDTLVHGVRLAPGALLLFDGSALAADPTAADPAADLTATDLAAIRIAARPLLAELSRRGLLPTPSPSAQFPTGRST